MFVLAVSGRREASLEAVARPGGLDVVRGCTVDGKKYATHARTHADSSRVPRTAGVAQAGIKQWTN